MVFSSVTFMFLFLPVTLLVHFLLPARFRNGWLLAVSLVFYAWGEPRYVFLMLASIGLNYIFGLGIDAARRAGSRRGAVLWLLAAVVYNVCTLFFFKYAHFAAGLIDAALGTSLSRTALFGPIALPVGISFFTFQIFSYVIDVYRGQVPVQRSVAKLALYISLFPQLIAGPIVRYADVAAQIDRRAITFEKAYGGMLRFAQGFVKKVLLSNTAAGLANYVFDEAGALYPDGRVPAILAWAGVAAYALQIYFDFSGYSDMAIGLGKIFGFDFLENFRHPYIARTLKEFWRRWHISLSGWFRDYVYIPLGGSRRGPARTYINLFIVFLLTGLWHGASLNFVLWGLWHGLFLILERTPALGWMERAPRPLQHVYTLFVVLVGWVLFRAADLPAAWQYLSWMFSPAGWNPANLLPVLTAERLAACLAGAVLCAPVCARAAGALAARPRARAVWECALMAAFVLSLLYLVSGGLNPFIYFRF